MGVRRRRKAAPPLTVRRCMRTGRGGRRRCRPTMRPSPVCSATWMTSLPAMRRGGTTPLQRTGRPGPPLRRRHGRAMDQRRRPARHHQRGSRGRLPVGLSRPPHCPMRGSLVMRSSCSSNRRASTRCVGRLPTCRLRRGRHPRTPRRGRLLWPRRPTVRVRRVGAGPVARPADLVTCTTRRRITRINPRRRGLPAARRWGHLAATRPPALLMRRLHSRGRRAGPGPRHSRGHLPPGCRHKFKRVHKRWPPRRSPSSSNSSSRPSSDGRRSRRQRRGMCPWRASSPCRRRSTTYVLRSATSFWARPPRRRRPRQPWRQRQRWRLPRLRKRLRLGLAATRPSRPPRIRPPRSPSARWRPCNYPPRTRGVVAACPQATAPPLGMWRVPALPPPPPQTRRRLSARRRARQRARRIRRPLRLARS